MVTISACMIVKNEEAVLARAIECFRYIADEIIVVDTGSTDRTKEIASRYTDKIFDYKWTDDFSAARNFSFTKATMDYIYVPDADEVIDEVNQQRFMQLKKALVPEIDIVQMKYGNQLYLGSTYNFDFEYRPKLYKRLRTFTWMDPIHETVDMQLHTFDSDIVVMHMPQSRHAGRDFSIFGRIAKKGDLLSKKLHQLYARELYIAGSSEDFLQAYPYFEATLHNEKADPEQIKQSQCIVAKCGNITGNSGELFKAAIKNAIGGISAEICFELGEYYYGQGDYEEAATWYYTAAFGAEPELNIRYTGDYPLIKLSACFEMLENADEAEKYKKLAETWAPPLEDK